MKIDLPSAGTDRGPYLLQAADVSAARPTKAGVAVPASAPGYGGASQAAMGPT